MSPLERSLRLQHRITLINRVELRFRPLFRVCRTQLFYQQGQFIVLFLITQLPLVVHRPETHFECIEEFHLVWCRAINWTRHLLRFDLPSAVDAATGTGHQFDVIVVTLRRLELSDDVLNMLESVGCHELDGQASVGHLLVVSVLPLLIVEPLIWFDVGTEHVFGSSPVDVLEVAIGGPPVQRSYCESIWELTGCEELFKPGLRL